MLSGIRRRKSQRTIQKAISQAETKEQWEKRRVASEDGRYAVQCVSDSDVLQRCGKVASSEEWNERDASQGEYGLSWCVHCKPCALADATADVKQHEMKG